jgi:hypothetical protein
MALNRWNLQNWAMTVVDACAINDRDKLDLSPPYQRGLVWTDEQRVNLIRSLIEGIPCGIVYRNFRGFDKATPYAIVDGKQRIDTVRRFVDGELVVPANWFDAADLTDGDGSTSMVSYLDLSDQGQRIFDMSSLSVYETHKLTLHGEEMLYERVNYGGTPHPVRS